jgi:hypothetical protein
MAGMTTFELDRLIEKTEERIKNACADAFDGVTVPNGKWVQLGSDVTAALDSLKGELNRKAAKARRSVVAKAAQAGN